MLQAFGIGSAILSVLAYPGYLRDIFRGTTRPQRVTWLIYLFITYSALLSQIRLGATWSLGLTITQALAMTLIFGLSIRLGVGGSTLFDRICLAIGFSSLLLIVFVHQPIAALVLAVIADGIGTLPTAIKGFQDPGSETLSAWILDSLAGLLAVFAVGRFDLPLLLLPAAIMIENAVVATCILLGRHRAMTNS